MTRERRGRTKTVRQPLWVELLECRQLPSNVYTVTNTLDDGSTGSLRWAITQVDEDPSDSAANPDAIGFNIPQSDPGFSAGVWTIAPLSALPPVSAPVVIDGYTQAGAAPNTNGPGLGDNAHLTVVLRGDQEIVPLGDATAGAGLLVLTASNIVVRGLVIERFTPLQSSNGGAGISIGPSASGDVVEGNFLGTDDASSPGLGNLAGVIVLGNDNTVGGTTPDARNIVSGSGSGEGWGVEIEGSGNVVEGNFIGTDTTGQTSLPNNFAGVFLNGNASTNTIGGTTAAARNVIVGGNIDTKDFYYSYGVIIHGAGVTGNVMAGNYIGTDVAGTFSVVPVGSSQWNTKFGVLVVGNNTVGGTVAGAGNVIAGNGAVGIATGEDFGTHGPTIEGNLIGTDASGLKALPDGIGVEVGSSFTTVGGTTAAARNIISGNQGTGVSFAGPTFADAPVFGTADLVAGNFIGTDATGAAALPNQSGIDLDGASGVTIGGLVRGAGNVVSGNAGIGVILSAARSLVAGNFIGTDASGQDPLGNGSDGILLGPFLTHNTIGGTAAGAGNTIDFNRGAGVAVVGSESFPNRIEGNSIFGNIGLGIDLGGRGVPRANDSADADAIANYPFLTGVSYSAGSTAITGTVSGIINGNDRIEFFASPTADPSGFGQGKTYLGAIEVAPDSTGTAHFTFTAAGDLSGQVISATATDPYGSTSEFSPDVPPGVSVGPPVLLTVTPNPALPGQPVNVTATVPSQSLRLGNTLLGNSVAPVGVVAFFVDGQLAESLALTPNGLSGTDAGSTAIGTILAGMPGTHVITARYEGGNFPPSAAAPPVSLHVAGALPTFVNLRVGPELPVAGQAVTLDVSVASYATVPGQSLPAPQGIVDFYDGTQLFASRGLDRTGHASVIATSLPTGANNIVAVYEGNALYAGATSNNVSETAAPSDGPTVLSVARYAVRNQPTAIVLTFSQAVDASTGQDPTNYRLIGPGGRAIPINTALYDGSAEMIRLMPAQKLSLRARYRLVVNGTSPHGVSNLYGELLDGADTGHPGTDYVTTITRRNLVPVGPARGGQLVHQPHAAGLPHRGAR